MKRKKRGGGGEGGDRDTEKGLEKVWTELTIHTRRTNGKTSDLQRQI